jgi:hypothetical protein
MSRSGLWGCETVACIINPWRWSGVVCQLTWSFRKKFLWMARITPALQGVTLGSSVLSKHDADRVGTAQPWSAVHPNARYLSSVGH